MSGVSIVDDVSIVRNVTVSNTCSSVSSVSNSSASLYVIVTKRKLKELS